MHPEPGRKPAAHAESLRPLVRIPRSASRRGAIGAARLIRRIDDRKHGPFRLVGKFLRPGRLIPECELWPDPDWPAVPILLEITD